MINVKKYIELIKDLDYVAIKFEAPHLHENFPDEYVPGKDLDLIVTKEHQDKLYEITSNYMKQYEKDYQVRYLPTGIDLRKSDGSMEFGVDISTSYNNLRQSIIDRAIKEHRIVNDTKVPPIRDEVYFRAYTYHFQRHKQYHQDYITENVSHLDEFFILTLWPSVHKYFDEIENKLREHFIFFDSRTFTFNDREEYYNGLIDLYTIDDSFNDSHRKRLYDEKYGHMFVSEPDCHKIGFKMMLIDLPEPRMRNKTVGEPVSTIIEHVKRWHRENYRDRVNNNVYDLVIHSTDNHEQSRNMIKVMNKYRGWECTS